MTRTTLSLAWRYLRIAVRLRSWRSLVHAFDTLFRPRVQHRRHLRALHAMSRICDDCGGDIVTGEHTAECRRRDEPPISSEDADRRMWGQEEKR